jgi:hypothetical protein
MEAGRCHGQVKATYFGNGLTDPGSSSSECVKPRVIPSSLPPADRLFIVALSRIASPQLFSNKTQ